MVRKNGRQHRGEETEERRGERVAEIMNICRSDRFSLQIKVTIYSSLAMGEGEGEVGEVGEGRGGEGGGAGRWGWGREGGDGRGGEGEGEGQGGRGWEGRGGEGRGGEGRGGEGRGGEGRGEEVVNSQFTLLGVKLSYSTAQFFHQLYAYSSPFTLLAHKCQPHRCLREREG